MKFVNEICQGNNCAVRVCFGPETSRSKDDFEKTNQFESQLCSLAKLYGVEIIERTAGLDFNCD